MRLPSVLCPLLQQQRWGEGKEEGPGVNLHFGCLKAACPTAEPASFAVIAASLLNCLNQHPMDRGTSGLGLG